MLECYSFKSLEETVSRLAAKDGMTIRQITSEPLELSFLEELKRSVGNRWGSQTESANPNTETTSAAIQKCFTNYDERRERGPLLEKLFTALCSIPPTSTQSERNFSLSGIFVSKLLTRFTQKHVDMFSFLKSQFLHSI